MQLCNNFFSLGHQLSCPNSRGVSQFSVQISLFVCFVLTQKSSLQLTGFARLEKLPSEKLEGTQKTYLLTELLKEKSTGVIYIKVKAAWGWPVIYRHFCQKGRYHTSDQNGLNASMLTAFFSLVNNLKNPASEK